MRVMAKHVVTTTELTDDLSGGVAHRTVTFSFDGVGYEIDLSQRNARAFEKALTPYMAVARKSRTRRTAAARGSKPVARDLSAIRSWAEANGHSVASRGRIPAAVQAAYQDAQH